MKHFLKCISLFILILLLYACSFTQMASLKSEKITRLEIENKGILDTSIVRISGSIYKDKSYYNFNFKGYQVVLKSLKNTYSTNFKENFKYYFNKIKADNYQLLLVSPINDTIKYEEQIPLYSGEIKHIRIFVVWK